MKKAITFELRGHPMDDGRMYLDSPDLKGFHFVLEEGQEIEEITDTLAAFVAQYLKAEIKRLVPTETPRDFVQRSAGAAPARRMFPFMAEIKAPKTTERLCA